MDESSASSASIKMMSIEGGSSRVDDKILLRKSPLYGWDVKMVLKWLGDENLKDYIPLFKDHMIDGTALLKMDYDGLKAIGVVSVSDRSKILSAVKFAHRACPYTPENDRNSVNDQLDDGIEQYQTSQKGKNDPSKGTGIGGKLQLKKMIEDRFNALQMFSSKLSAPKEFVFSKIALSKSVKPANSSLHSPGPSSISTSNSPSNSSASEAKSDLKRNYSFLGKPSSFNSSEVGSGSKYSCDSSYFNNNRSWVAAVSNKMKSSSSTQLKHSQSTNFSYMRSLTFRSSSSSIKGYRSTKKYRFSSKPSIKTMDKIEGLTSPTVDESVAKLKTPQSSQTPAPSEIPTLSPIAQDKSSTVSSQSSESVAQGKSSSQQQRQVKNADSDSVQKAANSSSSEKLSSGNVATSRSDSLSSKAHLTLLLKSLNGTSEQRSSGKLILTSPKRTSPEQELTLQIHPNVPSRSDSLTPTFKRIENKKSSTQSRKDSHSESSPANGDDLDMPTSIFRAVLAPPVQNRDTTTPKFAHIDPHRKHSAPLTKVTTNDVVRNHWSGDELDPSKILLTNNQSFDKLYKFETPSSSDDASANVAQKVYPGSQGCMSTDSHSGYKLMFTNFDIPKGTTAAQYAPNVSDNNIHSKPTPSECTLPTNSKSDTLMSQKTSEKVNTDTLEFLNVYASGTAKNQASPQLGVRSTSDQNPSGSSKSKGSSHLLSSASNSTFPLQAYIGKDELVLNNNYIGERPPDELIVDHLESYFPGIEDELYTPTEEEVVQEKAVSDTKHASSSKTNADVELKETDENRVNELSDVSKHPVEYNATDKSPNKDSKSPVTDNTNNVQNVLVSKSSGEDRNPLPKSVSESKVNDYSSSDGKFEQKNQHHDSILETPIPKRDLFLENALQARKRQTFRKSDIQNRAQSAIISKRISRLAKRRITGGIMPSDCAANYNVNLDYEFNPPALKPPSKTLNNKLGYKINQRSSSIRMSKFNPKPLNLVSVIASDRNTTTNNQQSNEPVVYGVAEMKSSAFTPALRPINSTLKADDLNLNKLSINQKTFPLIPADSKRVEDTPTLKKEHDSLPHAENDVEANDLKDVLSNMLEGYQNEVHTTESRYHADDNKGTNLPENINRRVSLRVPGNTSDIKTLDIYGVMKTYECTEKRNTLISSRFSTDSQHNMRVGFKWRLGKVIGRGAFGTVYIGINLTTGDLMAVKQVNFGYETSSTVSKKRRQEESIKREIGFLKELQHEHIVAYYGCASVENTFNVFLEYVSGGSISSCLMKYGAFSDSCVRCFTAQILFGLEYLHSVNIIHRDIKGANVLVDSEGVAKISDFGISKRNQYNQAYHRVTRMSMQGTVPWMAPEVTRGKGYSAKVDIWSLGCLVLEMLTNRNPWYKVEGSVIYLLGKGKAPPIPTNLSQGAKGFLALCFNDNPELRPTATEILNDPNGYPDTHNPMSFDFKKWTSDVMPKRFSDDKCNTNTFDSSHSQTLNAV